MASGVEFDEDNISYAKPGSRPGIPGLGGGYGSGQREERGMAGWLIKRGFAKSYGSAQAVMLGIVVVNIIITYVAIKFLLL